VKDEEILRSLRVTRRFFSNPTRRVIAANTVSGFHEHEGYDDKAYRSNHREIQTPAYPNKPRVTSPASANSDPDTSPRSEIVIATAPIPANAATSAGHERPCMTPR